MICRLIRRFAYWLYLRPEPGYVYYYEQPRQGGFWPIRRIDQLSYERMLRDLKRRGYVRDDA